MKFTVQRKEKSAKRRLAAAVLTLALGSGCAFAEPAPEAVLPELEDVGGAILYEATTDTVLLEKEADKQLAPASMTKVMTAILVLEQNPQLEGELTVPEDAVSSKYCGWMDVDRLLAGEVISYQECMQYLLIPSGNEAATTFAFTIGGTFENFIEMMNAKAKELGCENTNFQEPTGLGGVRHYTSPRDMVKMCQYAMSFPKFREIVKMTSGAVPVSNMRDREFTYKTTNRVMDPRDNPLYESPYQPYVVGVKTGYTGDAGYCLSGCMEKDGLVFYSVAMRGGDVQIDGQWAQSDFLATIAMYEYADGFEAKGPAAEECNASVLSLFGGRKVALTVPENAKLLVQKGEAVEAAYKIPAFTLLPISQGEPYGSVTLTSGDTQRTFDLVAAESCGLSPVSIIIAALVVIAAAAVILRVSKKKK